jgi:cytochrome c5
VKLIKPIALVCLPAYFVALLLGASQVSANHKSDESITARIAPVGHVCIQGQKCKAVAAEVASEPTLATAPVTAPPRSGDDVYNTACAACHTTGAAGAPKLGDSAAWDVRAAKGLDGLLATAISGINAMPPRGLCMDCSDAELSTAIQYILNNSK